MEDPRIRRVTSVRQLELLLNFLEQHKELALGRVRSKEARALSARLWEQCAVILNTDGPYRDAKEWSRFWNDYKSRVRGKVININKSLTGTGGGPPLSALTPIEERVVGIIGRDVGPIPGVRQDPFHPTEYNAWSNNDEEIQPAAPSTSQSSALEIPEVVEELYVYDSQPLPNQPVSQPPISILSPVDIDIHPPNASAPPDVSQPLQPGDRSTSRRPRRPRNPSTRPRPTLQRASREALEESRSAIAQREVMRARTEELLAESMLRQAEVAERHERVMERIADSFQMVAEAIDRMSRSGVP